MYLDKATEMEPGVTARDATISENVVDLKAPGVMTEHRGIVLMQVTVAFNNRTTLTAFLVTADNAALSTNPVTINSTGAVALASWSLGAQFVFTIPEGTPLKRYLGISWSSSGGTANSTGLVKAWFSPLQRNAGVAFIGAGTVAAPFTK